MIDGVCIRCGYMKSGNKISVSYDDKKSDLAVAHAKGEELNIETSYQGISIPFHPGALKYYKELGYNVQ